MLLSYIAEKAVPFFISVISTLITFGVINQLIFLIYKKKVPLSSFLIGTLCMAVPFHFIQFFIHYIFFYPKLLPPIADGIIIFPNPLFVFIYYLITRYIFKLHNSQTIFSLEAIFAAQYFSLLIFKAYSNGFSYIVKSEIAWPAIFVIDLLSMVCTWITMIVLYVVFKILVKKKDLYLEVPSSFPIGNNFNELIIIFFSVCGHYIVLVSVCILLMLNRRSSITGAQILLYIIMGVIVVNCIIDKFRILRIRLMEWQTKSIETSIQSIIHANNEFHNIKHDFYNILQIYGGYMENNDMAGLKKYHNSLLKITKYAGNTLDMLEALKERTAVYTLFDLKSQRAMKLGVKFEVSEISSISRIKMNDLDLCRIFSNSLDNAIEAAVESDEKIVRLHSEQKDDFILVSVANTCSTDVIPSKIFTPGFTTKDNHSGQGLSAISNIITENDNCSMRITCQNRLFTINFKFTT